MGDFIPPQGGDILVRYVLMELGLSQGRTLGENTVITSPAAWLGPKRWVRSREVPVLNVSSAVRLVLYDSGYFGLLSLAVNHCIRAKHPRRG